MTDNAGNVWYPVIGNKIEKRKIPATGGDFGYLPKEYVCLLTPNNPRMPVQDHQ